jgi:hypothetical protein
MRMRWLLVVLVGCGGSPMLDAGPDSGGVDAGQDAGYDAGDGLVTYAMTYTYENLNGASMCPTTPLCQKSARVDAGHAARLEAIYADAGCVVSHGPGAYSANCNSLCGHDSPNGCCDAWAPGCAPTLCAWAPP